MYCYAAHVVCCSISFPCIGCVSFMLRPRGVLCLPIVCHVVFDRRRANLREGFSHREWVGRPCQNFVAIRLRDSALLPVVLPGPICIANLQATKIQHLSHTQIHHNPMPPYTKHDWITRDRTKYRVEICAEVWNVDPAAPGAHIGHSIIAETTPHIVQHRSPFIHNPSFQRFDDIQMI